MARYLQTAAEANKTAKILLDLVPEPLRPQAAEHIARIMNYGLRCAPRAVHSTVRLNAVREAVRGLPVKVTMEQREGLRGTYNALVTQPTGGLPSTEGDEIEGD